MAPRPAPCACSPSCTRLWLPALSLRLGIAAVYRYRDPGEVRGDLDGLRAAGLIDAAGDGAIKATETGRAVLAAMYQAGAEVTGQL